MVYFFEIEYRDFALKKKKKYAKNPHPCKKKGVYCIII